MMPRPNEKQVLAFQEQHRHVAYGGARGGGKSWFVRWKATLLSLRYPGIKILITRRTYRELLNNHIEPLKDLLHGIAEKLTADERVARGSHAGKSAAWTDQRVCSVQEVLRPTGGTSASSRDLALSGKDFRSSRMKYLAPML